MGTSNMSGNWQKSRRYKITKPQLSKGNFKEKEKLVTGRLTPGQTGRLTVGRKLTSPSPSQQRVGLMLGLADLMLDCWLEVSCIRMVLRTANSIKVFRGFPWSQSKCWVGTQIPRCTACFSCSPTNVNIENFALH
jgi:hypothetical protein